MRFISCTLTPPSSSSSSTPDPAAQLVDTIFQSFDPSLHSLESNLLATHPQLSGFISLLNSNLDAPEAPIVTRL
ncbi:MAG TPA: hypothetical protein VH592_26740 [Gemmataceae bacterium]|jgi:hypothetical protein